MSISAAETVLNEADPVAVDVQVSETALSLTLSDGRHLITPLARFPRLRNATAAQRAHWRLIGVGHGIHWPDIDEDISVRALLGRPS